MNKGLVSIITPVYNCEQYIDECIASVVGQTDKSYPTRESRLRTC